MNRAQRKSFVGTRFRIIKPTDRMQRWTNGEEGVAIPFDFNKYDVCLDLGDSPPLSDEELSLLDDNPLYRLMRTTRRIVYFYFYELERCEKPV